MKNTKFLKIALISLAIIASAIQLSASIRDVLQKKQERNLPAFNELNLSIYAEVVLVQGNTQKFEIHATDKLLEIIQTEVKNKVLTVKYSERLVRNTEKVKIYITMTDVNALKISGSGNIHAQGKLNATNIAFSISGSGNITIDDLKASNISASISGSADIKIGGEANAELVQANISGSGNISAAGLAAQKVEVNLSGSGNCTVNATESIQIRISGSGNVYYSGKATIDAKISGSGKVKPLNSL
jgi:hypothetical protein